MMITLPDDKQALLDDLLPRLTALRGVAAVVIGGSYARGTARPDSDLDLALYYHDAAPFAIDEVRAVARAISASEPTVTDFYGWGAWVNGGAWITTRAGKVDFLYRSIEQVRRTIADAHAGKTQIDYEQQPTFGFHSVIYLAETRDCAPIYDPDGVIAALQAAVAVYPPALKDHLIKSSLWSAEFTFYHARGYATRGDAYNTVGCLLRALYHLTHALHALNETYFAGDKGSMERIAAFPLKPENYIADVNALLRRPGDDLNASVREIERLWQRVKALADDYEPLWRLRD
jgi:hypothetical protein